jgi:uncharacterized membrane protein
MSPTDQVLCWWLAFAATHLVLSSLPVRQPLVARLGEQAFRGLYSLVAFATFIPLVWTYAHGKHTGPLLWAIPMTPVLRWLVYTGMGLALVLLVASFAQPSPAAVRPGKAAPKGVLRVTRHPLMMAFALFGLVHLIPNGFASDVVFFGGFPVFALLGAWHQDQRKLALDPGGYQAFHATTPFLPFTGRDTIAGLREMSPIVIGVGIAATVIVRYFHTAWFGG